MNQNIELVRKWLADKDSVTQEELVANEKSAYAADAADAAADAADAADAAADAADAAAYAAYAAAAAAADADADAADTAVKYWAECYDKITKLKKQRGKDNEH